MKNKKIHFQKLINHHSGYSRSEILQILEWMFKSSKKYNLATGTWSVDGFDKLVYEYSANTHPSYSKIEGWKHIRQMFINAIVVENKTVQKWRDDFGVELNKSKFLNFITGENDYLFFNGKDIFEVIESLSGLKLKKEFFHPKYEDRNNPFIVSAKFTISDSGCHIFVNYTFENCKDSIWHEEFWKREESMEDFFQNSFAKIDSWLIEPQILKANKMPI